MVEERAAAVDELVMKLQPGTFLRIPLRDGTFGYGRVLRDADMVALYEHRTTAPSADLESIAACPVLFSVSVRQKGLTRWTLIGQRELDARLSKPIVQFMQDVADPKRCTIFDSSGARRAATPEECVGLERAAVWDAAHVAERLLDAFEGRVNAAEQHLRVRLS